MSDHTSAAVPDALPNLHGIVGLPHAFNPTGWIEPTNADLHLLLHEGWAPFALEVEGDRYTFDFPWFDALFDELNEAGYQLLASPFN